MRKKRVLDPLWILSGSYLDPEYFNYVLLAASQKYREDLETGNLDHFYELFFHSLNLNNLAVSGSIFDFKMHPIFKNERIQKITQELRQILTKKDEVVEIFRNANYVFLSLILDYMDIQIDILDGIEFFYLNTKIHEESEIFLVVNQLANKEYSIWKIQIDPKRDFGYSFKKIRTITINEIKENALREELDAIGDPKLENMIESKNVCFAVLDGISEKLGANVLKDTILLNRGVVKDKEFEPLIVSELCGLFMTERLMPFTLSQWMD